MRTDIALSEKASKASRASALLCSGEVQATVLPSALFYEPDYTLRRFGSKVVNDHFETWTHAAEWMRANRNGVALTSLELFLRRWLI